MINPNHIENEGPQTHPGPKWKLQVTCSWDGRPFGLSQETKLDCPRSAPIGPPDAARVASNGCLVCHIDVKLVVLGRLDYNEDGICRVCCLICWKANEDDFGYQRIGMLHSDLSDMEWAKFEHEKEDICIV